MVLGGDYQRLHEEVIAAGGYLREGRFARMGVGELQRALEAALPIAAPPELRQRLASLWASHEQPLLAALEARKVERTESLQKLLAERAAKEMRDTESILTELRASILAELKQPEVMQMELFTAPEKEQLEWNRRFLEQRVAQIPDEIAREQAAIRTRFADPQARLFPVAVTYLVPERLAVQGQGGYR